MKANRLRVRDLLKCLLVITLLLLPACRGDKGDESATEVSAPGVTDEVLYDVQLAVDEACTNIITHGYAGLDPGSIILDLEVHPAHLTVTITDFGHSFEPDTTPIPDVDAPIEERELGGFVPPAGFD